jgi:hypothetical protein
VDIHQNQLFVEDEDDAFDAAIRFLGGYKAVAMWLWPQLKPETAYARLKACFNDSKDEKLSWVDGRRIMAKAREKGCHIIMFHLCDELFYERPRTITKEKVEAELQEEADVLLERVESIADKLRKVRGKL